MFMLMNEGGTASRRLKQWRDGKNKKRKEGTTEREREKKALLFVKHCCFLPNLNVTEFKTALLSPFSRKFSPRKTVSRQAFVPANL